MTTVGLLHGFTGAPEALTDLVPSAHGLTVWSPTLFGHGPKPRLPVPWSFSDEVEHLADSLEKMPAPRILLGYSLGGRLALAMALSHPDLVQSLILVGASPGLRTDAERATRRRDDERWCKLLAQGLTPFLTEWVRQPVLRPSQPLPEAQLKLQATIRGAHTPLGLTAALRWMGLGAMPSYWDRLEALPVRTHFVVGSEDKKFGSLADAMLAKAPQASLHLVPHAGHQVHLETPAALRALLEAEVRNFEHD